LVSLLSETFRKLTRDSNSCFQLDRSRRLPSLRFPESGREPGRQEQADACVTSNAYVAVCHHCVSSDSCARFAELWLSRLNQRHVRAHADEVPLAFREMVDEPTYRRSVVIPWPRAGLEKSPRCLMPCSLSACYSAVCAVGVFEKSQQLSARLFWQWPVFFSLQALH